MTYASDERSPGRHGSAGVAGVVLAGGASRRMGGRPKALLPWPPDVPAAGTFLDAVAGALKDAAVGPVAVVTGTHHAEIVAAHGSAPWEMVFNARHAEGQLTSLWRGLDWAEALPEPPVWLLVALVDTPAVRPDTLRRLVAAALAATDDRSGPDAPRGPGLIRPTVGDRHGHPVLWRRALWPRLRQTRLDTGARPLVHALVAAGEVLDVPVDDPGVLRDVDTDADYRALARDRQA